MNRRSFFLKLFGAPLIAGELISGPRQEIVKHSHFVHGDMVVGEGSTIDTVNVLGGGMVTAAQPPPSFEICGGPRE